MSYQTKREHTRWKQALESAAERDIAPIPPVADPYRRAASTASFRAFCESYQPGIYRFPWSEDHLRVIAAIEEVARFRQLCAFAMPRGSGKTSLCESAVIWATLTGRSQYCLLLGPDEAHAQQNLQAIQSELTTNDVLAADFPEICYPFARLEGINQRRLLYNGHIVPLEITKQRIILPVIPGSRAGAAIIQTAGITGRIRGMKYSRPDGSSVRPSLVIIDDPQTDESARSPSQCETRERILAGAVLGLAGPGRKIAGIMPCTVIRPGDMADNILDRDKHPEWNGTRTKMVYAFPQEEKLWEEYGRIRADSLRAGNAGREAMEFYRANRAAMDAGARVAWEARHNEDELSAIQHAMNLRFQDERAFWAEYQNEPLPEQEARGDDLTPDQVASKINRLARGSVPMGCNRLTAFVDVQGSLLYHVVTAWEDDFTGYVIDYGTFPDQKRAYFTLRDAKFTLAKAVKAAGLEGQVHGGLEALTADLLGREWQRDDGATLKIERCLIDANWGTSTDIIYQFCRQSAHSGVVMPSHGRYVGASSQPMREWAKKPGDRVGLNWRLPNVQGRRAVRYAIYDTNWWKSFIHARLSTAMGDRGGLSLFGAKPEIHRLFADHITAEFRVRTEGRGRTVDEWKLRPERPDNHWLDCLVGCAVAASMQGVALAEGGTGAPEPARKKVKFSELARRRRA